MSELYIEWLHSASASVSAPLDLSSPEYGGVGEDQKQLKVRCISTSKSLSSQCCILHAVFARSGETPRGLFQLHGGQGTILCGGGEL